jgi:hypothetical protein
MKFAIRYFFGLITSLLQPPATASSGVPSQRPAECLLDVQLECSWKRDMRLDGKALALKMLLRAEISTSSLGSWTLGKTMASTLQCAHVPLPLVNPQPFSFLRQVAGERIVEIL